MSINNDIFPTLYAQNSSGWEYSDKQIVRVRFSEIKTLGFRYNSGIIWYNKEERKKKPKQKRN